MHVILFSVATLFNSAVGSILILGLLKVSDHGLARREKILNLTPLDCPNIHLKSGN